MVNVVVDHRRQQIVGQGDGIEVTREVQVDVFHRDDLGMAATSCAALHAKNRPQRGLAQANHSTFTNVVERVAQAHCGGGLALAGGSWTDRSDQDQFAVGAAGQGVNVVQRNFGFGPAKRLQRAVWDTQIRSNLGNRVRRCGLCNFDVRFHGGSFLSMVLNALE